MTRALRLFVLSWILSCGSAWASSQDPEDALRRDVRPGDVVRVFAESLEEPVIGRYVSASEESLRVKPHANAPVAIAREDVLELDVSPKQTRGTWKGALVGALIGVAATAAMVLTHQDSEGPVALMGIFFVPIGTGWGALEGANDIDYHWQVLWKRV